MRKFDQNLSARVPVKAVVSHAAKLALGLTLGLIVLAANLGAASENAASKELKIKAAFLYNFARYVEWPARRFENAKSPLVIAVFGNEALGRELALAVENREANGHPVVVKSLDGLDDLKSVHLLFLAPADESQLPEVLALSAENGVLTVGESDTFEAQGGMITFMREADKVRFAINREMGDRAGLKISAQLLKLAAPSHKKI